jgi:dTDP-glucose 4,6-dehydratase
LNAYMDKRIPVYGSGFNVRDWLHVTDHCNAILRVLESGKIGDTYVIGGESERTNIDVARHILTIMRKPISLIDHVLDRKGHDFRYAVDICHIKHELGWRPSIKFQDGLVKTIDWYLNNMEWVRSCVNLG